MPQSTKQDILATSCYKNHFILDFN